MPDTKKESPEVNQEKEITWNEIQGQPELWRKIELGLSRQRAELDSFFAALPSGCEAIFTGAGSSAFVGEAVAAIFSRKTGIPSRALPTTDIVTHPELCLPSARPLLLVSFARSGNSPESLAAVELAEKINPGVRHLIITCNGEGALALRKSTRPACLVLLPPEANDQGLAMIGSVTGMMLATLLIADRALPSGAARKLVEALAKAGTALLAACLAGCREIAALPMERLVCLGSGPLLGVAREAHLKVQELSDGRVVATFDSFLGFRHGPKAVVNANTFLLYLRSGSAYVEAYENDLCSGIQAELSPLGSLAITAGMLDPGGTLSDASYLLPLYLLPAQLIAVLKSQNLGLNPDSPSQRGAIHRVVRGVKIYPYKGEGE